MVITEVNKQIKATITKENQGWINSVLFKNSKYLKTPELKK